ncbi:CBU_0592 family membrane protein [Kistimonas asteriae]|uniref:CBU_0592 family membrane protein n=1 Tax=Kistimonas asteriae TaxID=517724 RepID=UPI001BAD29C8|nr:hypothetical protein [Kistimonas asteriae]
METINLFALAGVVAAIFHTCAYFLIQLDIIKPTHYSTLFLNLGGSVLFLISLSESFNIGSFLIQCCWFCIGITALYRKLKASYYSARSNVMA